MNEIEAGLARAILERIDGRELTEPTSKRLFGVERTWVARARENYARGSDTHGWDAVITATVKRGISGKLNVVVQVQEGYAEKVQNELVAQILKQLLI